MNNSMHILIPISGHSGFFPKEDFYFPKPLVEVAGIPMIEVVIKQLQAQFDSIDFFFVIDPEDSRTFSFNRTLELLAGKDTTIIEKCGSTSGALCSCLLAIDCINHDEPLIIANCDQIIEDNISRYVKDFQSKQCSAGVITFESIHPRWSYVVVDDNNDVIQTFEKEVASRNAIAGFYYFHQANIFFKAAKNVIHKHNQIEGNYFISSSLNEIILSGGSVLHSSVSSQSYHSFYSPAKIAEFEKTHYAKVIRDGSKSSGIVNVIIPAAGDGKRFAEAGWKRPKPFIDVNGKIMVEHVIKNVAPQSANINLLLRKEHLKANDNIKNRLERQEVEIIEVAKLTEGTASTVLLAREKYDNDQPLIIANSDQLVDFNVNHFISECLSRNLDGSILVFRDPTMNPKWSFVRINEESLVIEVAEKDPISDLATVGIYLFSNGKKFIAGALDMLLANDRTNNEFYTCPVYNYMIQKGARIGVYEVPMDAMSGLGTPDDLKAFLELKGAPPSNDSP